MSKTLSEEIEEAIPAIRDIGFKTWSAAIRQQAADIKALREVLESIRSGSYAKQRGPRAAVCVTAATIAADALAATDPNRVIGDDA